MCSAALAVVCLLCETKRNAAAPWLRRFYVLPESNDGLHVDFAVPGACGLQGVVDVVDVFDAGGFEPVAEGLLALLGVDGDAVFPCGAAAEDSVVLGAGLACQLEGLDEDGVGDARREVDERLVGHGLG